MIRRFHDWLRLREDETSPLGPGLGHVGHADNEFGGTGGSNKAEEAFRDISRMLHSSLAGHNGSIILNTIVSAILNEPKIPDSLQKQIKNRVSEKWSNVIDMNDLNHPGLGVGLANYPPTESQPSMDNVVVPPSADRQ